MKGIALHSQTRVAVQAGFRSEPPASRAFSRWPQFFDWRRDQTVWLAPAQLQRSLRKRVRQLPHTLKHESSPVTANWPPMLSPLAR